MRRSRGALAQRVRCACLMLLGFAVAACDSASASATSTPSARPSPALTGQLTVFAAGSLTEAFNDAKVALRHPEPGLSIAYSFAGSQVLVQQIQAGAPADVFASADTRNMQKLVDAGLVETPRTFVRNKLEIVVAAGNPKHITGLGDLGRADLTVVLCDSSVPCGLYGNRALQNANVTAHPRSLALDVKTVVQAIATGNADAGIVYVTDVKAAGASVAGVAIPDSQNVIAIYPIAVVKATTNPQAAAFFVDSAVSGAVQRALEERGFLSP